MRLNNGSFISIGEGRKLFYYASLFMAQRDELHDKNHPRNEQTFTIRFEDLNELVLEKKKLILKPARVIIKEICTTSVASREECTRVTRHSAGHVIA